MSLLDFPFQNHEDENGVSPLFAAVVSGLLGRLVATYRSVSVGICAKSFKKAFVRTNTDVEQEGLACSEWSN